MLPLEHHTPFHTDPMVYTKAYHNLLTRLRWKLLQPDHTNGHATKATFSLIWRLEVGLLYGATFNAHNNKWQN